MRTRSYWLSCTLFDALGYDGNKRVLFLTSMTPLVSFPSYVVHGRTIPGCLLDKTSAAYDTYCTIIQATTTCGIKGGGVGTNAESRRLVPVQQ